MQLNTIYGDFVYIHRINNKHIAFNCFHDIYTFCPKNNRNYFLIYVASRRKTTIYELLTEILRLYMKGDSTSIKPSYL